MAIDDILNLDLISEIIKLISFFFKQSLPFLLKAMLRFSKQFCLSVDFDFIIYNGSQKKRRQIILCCLLYRWAPHKLTKIKSEAVPFREFMAPGLKHLTIVSSHRT